MGGVIRISQHGQRRGVVVATLALLLALGASSVGAWTLDLFPFLYVERDAESGRRDTEVLWPLFQWEREPGHILGALRPLLSWESDDTERRRDFDLLWPFVHWRRENIGDPDDEHRHLRVLPLLTWKRHTAEGLAPWRLMVFPLIYTGRTGPEADERYLIVFPLWWSANNTRVFFPIFWSSPESFTALFPLWGHFRDLWGMDDLRFVLFPLWARSHRDEVVTDSALWPIFAWQRGGGVSGFRVWPLFGWERDERAERGVRGFFLWPLGHFRRATFEDGQPNNLFFLLPSRLKWEIRNSQLNVRWPLWGTLRNVHRRSWSIAWPLFWHTVDERADYTEDRLLWPIFRWQRGETHRALEVMPIAGRRERPGRRLRYVAFPFYTHSERWSERRTTETHALLPLFSRTVRHDLEDSTWRRTTWIFPTTWDRERSDGWRETHWMFPLFITRSDGYARSWGALFDLVQRGRTAEGGRWARVLWRFYRSDVDPDGTVHSDYNGLLLRRIREGDTTRTTFLGPLVRRTSGADGATWSWFDFSDPADLP